MIQYSAFNNYGLNLPFDNSVRESAGRRVEIATLTDIRSQALRLTPQQRVEMLRRPFRPVYSAGIWFFGEGGSRFHGSYKAPLDLEGRLAVAAELSGIGLKALEAHEPWEINADNYSRYRKLRQECGILVSVVAGIGGDFRMVDSQFGTTSSPLGTVREKYAARTVEQLKLVKMKIGRAHV